MSELSVNHLLGIKYLKEEDIELIFKTADHFKEVINRPIKKVPSLRDITIANLLILDEIFDSSLDATGTDEFLKILNTLGNENVFVISHKQDVLADKFRSTIRFNKERNFSHVVD